VDREYRQDVRRDGYAALASVSLGIGVECLGLLQQLDAATSNSDSTCSEVYVGRVQTEHFSPAQTTPGGQQDSGPVPGCDGFDKRGDLGGGRYGAFLGPVGTSAGDLTGILGDRTFAERGE
jgi:hypothetical protein